MPLREDKLDAVDFGDRLEPPGLGVPDEGVGRREIGRRRRGRHRPLDQPDQPVEALGDGAEVVVGRSGFFFPARSPHGRAAQRVTTGPPSCRANRPRPGCPISFAKGASRRYSPRRFGPARRGPPEQEL